MEILLLLHPWNNQTIYVDGIRGQIRDSISLKTSIFDGEFILLESGNNLIEIEWYKFKFKRN